MPFTLRELFYMLRARQKETWLHTSTLLAMMANTAFGKQKGKTFSPADFSPFPNDFPKHDVIRGMTFKSLKEAIKKGIPFGI